MLPLRSAGILAQARDRGMKGPASGGTDGASTGGRLRDICLISGDGANGTRYDMGLSKRKIKLDR